MPAQQLPVKRLEYKPDSRIKWLLLAVALAVLVIHASHYMPFIADDALISLRYSKRLLEGHGLTWNAGERVEGYSNFLWVLGAAGLGLARIDLIDAVRILGFLGMSAAIAALLCTHEPKNLKSLLLIFLVVLFLPLSAPIAAWTIGGMEQPLVAGLLAWAVVLCYAGLESRGQPPRTMLVPGLLFGLLCLTRLDGPLFTVAAIAAILIIGGIDREAWRRVACLAALPILFTLAQVVFRLAYYGEWVPNTALVKLNPSGKHTLDGWDYLLAGSLPILPLLVIAVFSIVISFWQNFQRNRMILLSMLAAAWTAYVVLIGGDIFPAWRHFVPLLVLFVLMAASGAEWIGAHLRPQSFAVAVVTCAVSLGAFFWLQSRDEENFRAISERWEWDGKAIGTLLKEAFGSQQPLMAVDPAGCLPYWSELPALDMLGLNDYYLPRHPPPNLGQGAIGHELGDGQYVLNRQPDLVVFLLPTGAEHGYFQSGRQMQEDPRFYREYSLARFEAHHPHKVISQIWVRKHSERIGIKRAGDRITVPAFLLNDNKATVARLSESGKLIVPISTEAPARIEKLEIPAGRWRIEAEGSQPSLKVRVVLSGDITSEPAVRSSETGRMLLDAQVPAVLEWEGKRGTTISIELQSATDETVEVSRLVLIRLQD
jgi:hypothetical protein